MRKAAELEPDHAGYFDTLAEVYFQMGEQAKAVESMRKATTQVSLLGDPSHFWYLRRLKRVQAGNPKTPLPFDYSYGNPVLSLLFDDDDD